MMRLMWVIDVVAPNRLAGWAYHPESPHAHIEILVHLRGEMISRQKAERLRGDLQRAQIGRGDHGFDMAISPHIAAADLPDLVITAVGADQAEHVLPVEAEKWTDSLSDPAPAFSKGSLALSAFDPEAVKRVLRLGSSYSQSEPLIPPEVNASEIVAEVDLEAMPRVIEMIERYREDKQSILDAIERDEWPIPDARNREGYAPGYDIAYWISGYAHYRLLSRTAEAHGVDGGRCYDFGGSSGRVCRHFAIQSDAWDVWLSDFKETSVQFVADYLPMNIKPFVNSAFPSLPLPDGYFDLAYGCSVFTHINELEIPWLLELRRILRVGGLACLSVHNDDTWRWLAEHPEDQMRKRNREWRPDVADLPEIPEGERIVVTHRDDDPYNCNVFHSDAYLRRVWGRFFKIVEIIPHSLGIQALVVCRRTT